VVRGPLATVRMSANPANQTADGTSAQINDSELARAARASQRARQNQRNREIATVLHLSVRAPSYEKWRYVGNWRGCRRLDGVGFHRRKVWEDGGLRSSTVGSEPGEMAPWTLEKAPLGAILHPFFDDFLRFFLRARPSGRKMGANNRKTRWF
jgi:hypothetical protein